MNGSATAVRRSMVTVCAAALARIAHGASSARVASAAEKKWERFAMSTIIAQCASAEGLRDFAGAELRIPRQIVVHGGLGVILGAYRYEAGSFIALLAVVPLAHEGSILDRGIADSGGLRRDLCARVRRTSAHRAICGNIEGRSGYRYPEKEERLDDATHLSQLWR